jgi:trehalose 6-phosphate phosphatase
MPPFASNWALFLDIDGTLLDIAATPDDVEPNRRNIVLIKRLHEVARGAVALISGRPIAGIDELFAPLKLPAAGQHGVERRDAAGRVHRQVVDASRLRRAATRIRDYAARHPGLVFEDKGYSVALHYRLAPKLRDAAHDLVLGVVAGLEGQFEAQHGKMVIELKPAGRDKGMAVMEFMNEAPFAGRVPVYLGDDLTDEHAFREVNRLGGHSIKVGEGATAARWRIHSSHEVRSWLDEWVKAQEKAA